MELPYLNPTYHQLTKSPAPSSRVQSLRLQGFRVESLGFSALRRSYTGVIGAFSERGHTPQQNGASERLYKLHAHCRAFSAKTNMVKRALQPSINANKTRGKRALLGRPGTASGPTLRASRPTGAGLLHPGLS